MEKETMKFVDCLKAFLPSEGAGNQKWEDACERAAASVLARQDEYAERFGVDIENRARRMLKDARALRTQYMA